MIDRSVLSTTPLRVLLVWCPDWSLRTAYWTHGHNRDQPLAITDQGLITAVSPAGAHEGVTVGLRIRQAQHRCPDLLLIPGDTEQQKRCFEPVCDAITDVVPLVSMVRPGVAAVRSVGGERFYGGAQQFLDRVCDRLRSDSTLQGLIPDPRAAIADGLFAAEQAAQLTSTTEPTAIIAPGASAKFLAPLATGLLPESAAQLTRLLTRMGIRTLGELAAMEREHLFARFGAAGTQAHRLACGDDVATLTPRELPSDFEVTVDFSDELTQVAQIVTSCIGAVDHFISRVSQAGLICHELRISLLSEDHPPIERVWRHPWELTARDITDRLTWQLTDDGSWACSGVRFTPIILAPIGDHATGLWGDRPVEHVAAMLSRLQGRLGHQGVRSGALGGGRLLNERRITYPWGEPPPDARMTRTDQPWPGCLPGPAPATVFDRPHPLRVTDDSGGLVSIDSRNQLSAIPFWVLSPGQPKQRITTWAGPWPIRQRWWQGCPTLHRFQFITDQQQAWVAVNASDGWWAEARYD